MTAQKVIAEIFETALKVSVEKDRVKSIFEKSGIAIGADMKISFIHGDHTEALGRLMGNLSEMAVVKISAKQIIRKSGLAI